MHAPRRLLSGFPGTELRVCRRNRVMGAASPYTPGIFVQKGGPAVQG